jgi:hypothetical protein
MGNFVNVILKNNPPRILEIGFLALENETGYSETSVGNYHYTLCNGPEERSSLTSTPSPTFISAPVQ